MTRRRRRKKRPTGFELSCFISGIVLSWNMTLGKGHAEITNYQLFAYQETSAAPSTNLWKKVCINLFSNNMNVVNSHYIKIHLNGILRKN